MKRLFLFILILIAQKDWAQGVLVPIGGTRPIDTAYVARSFRVDSFIVDRALKAASAADSNKAIWVDQNGIFRVKNLYPIDTTPLHNQIVLMANKSDTLAYLYTIAAANVALNAKANKGDTATYLYTVASANAALALKAGKIDTQTYIYTIAAANTALALKGSLSGNNTWTGTNFFTPTLTASSGTVYGLKVDATYNISGTGSAANFYSNFTGSRSGTGICYLYRGDNRGTLVWAVDTNGQITSKQINISSGNLQISNGSLLTNGNASYVKLDNGLGVIANNSYSATASTAFQVQKLTNDVTRAMVVYSAGSPLVANDSDLVDGTRCMKNIRVTGTAPTIAAGAGAGTGPTISITNNDNGYRVSLTAGTSPTADGVLFTVTYNLAKAKAPINTLAPTSKSAIGVAWISSETTTTCVVSGNVVAGTTYTWNFHNVEPAN